MSQICSFFIHHPRRAHAYRHADKLSLSTGQELGRRSRGLERRSEAPARRPPQNISALLRPLCLACPLDSPPSISMIGGSLCTDSTSRCPPFQRPPTPELTLGTWFACAARQPARACRGDGCGADWCGVAAGLFALRVGGDSFLFLPFLLLLLDL